MDDNNFENIFSQFFSNKKNYATKPNTQNYEYIFNKLKYIKSKMISDKRAALKLDTKDKYICEILKSYDEILKYLRNL